MKNSTPPPCGVGRSKEKSSRKRNSTRPHARKKRSRPARSPAVNRVTPYVVDGESIIWNKPTRNGTVPTLLANFAARIVADIIHDDGVEKFHTFEIEAGHRARNQRFQVPAQQFFNMNWGVNKLGATAIVSPGFTTKDHLRAAIQHLSGDVPRQVVYAHLGWRMIGDEWCYLHAGGAIGPNGPVSGAETDLPDQLTHYTLPVPPSDSDLAVAVQASLRILDLAPDEVTVPLFAAVWRSTLGPGGTSRQTNT